MTAETPRTNAVMHKQAERAGDPHASQYGYLDAIALSGQLELELNAERALAESLARSVNDLSKATARCRRPWGVRGMKNRNYLKPLTLMKLIMNTNCMRCEYEEADGALRNHCVDCARAVVRAFHKRVSKALEQEAK